MLRARRGIVSLVGVAVLTVWVGPAWGAESADGRFYRAYYLEQAQGELTAAAGLYAEVVADRGADPALRSQAKVRLARLREELAATDFARLMPPNVLLYAELNRPGEQLMKLLNQLGLLADGGLPPAGGRRVAVSPALIQGTLGIRGAAVAVTGFNPIKQVPTGVLVFHHGDMDVIRGLIETGLPMGAKPVEPIAGFPTYDVEGEAFVTLTNRLAVASPERGPIQSVLQRLNGKVTDSLADSPALAEYRDARQSSLLFFMVNAKPLMPLVKSMMAAEVGNAQDMALAEALLDLDSVQSLIGQLRVRDDGVSCEVALRMDEEHRSLVFNLLRTPAVNTATLRSVPAGAAAVALGALNEAPSRFGGAASTTTDGPRPPVTLLDIGRELFANVTTVAVYALPPESEAPPECPIPDVGAVITVIDPAKSEALWTQLLGVASLAAGVGAIEGETADVGGVTVRSFEFPEHVTVYFATVGQDVLIASSRSAISRSMDAKKTGRSVLDDDVLGPRITAFGPNTTKGVLVHPRRCFEMMRPFIPDHDAAEAHRIIDKLASTVLSIVVEHSDHVLRFSADVTGMPDIADVLAYYIDQEVQQQEVHQAFAHAQKRNDWDSALAVIDEAMAHRPGDVSLLRKKFDVLAVGRNDRAAAQAVGDELFAAYHDDASALNAFAWDLLTESRYGGGYAELALRVSERSNDLTDHGNWMHLDTLALAKFETGDVQEAIVLEKQAIERSHGAGAKELEAALKRFEDAAERAVAAGRE